MIEELERDKILKAIPNLPVEKQDTVKRILEELNKRKAKTNKIIPKWEVFAFIVI